MVEPVWDSKGLAPAIVQDATNGAVLMLAWMNQESLAKTRETGDVHFWSRSRKSLWKKGETSGNVLHVVELRIDCDGDAILILARAHGPACHTGQTSCFYRALEGHAVSPATHVVDRLAEVLNLRRDLATGQKSYTRSLLDGGYEKILAKIAEEHGELAAELPAGPDAAVVHETADLLFHVMVGLTARRIPIDEVWRELARRFGIGGHDEKAQRTK
jgi:phosphoribosyl-ATP pyrophosphohydrolase/phosphoribosyl-AMP cyclohydrolase